MSIFVDVFVAVTVVTAFRWLFVDFSLLFVTVVTYFRWRFRRRYRRYCFNLFLNALMTESNNAQRAKHFRSHSVKGNQFEKLLMQSCYLFFHFYGQVLDLPLALNSKRHHLKHGYVFGENLRTKTFEGWLNFSFGLATKSSHNNTFVSCLPR